MKKFALILMLLISQEVVLAQSAEMRGNLISAVGLGSTTAFPNASQITIALEHIKPTLREAVNENQRTIIITQNGEAKAVVQDIKSYENLQNSLNLLKLKFLLNYHSLYFQAGHLIVVH